MSEKRRMDGPRLVGTRGKAQTEEVVASLHKRDVLLRRLMKSLEHLPEDYRYAVLTSWMGLDRLEHLVKFLEGKL